MKFLTEILAKAGITSNYFKLDTSATPPIEAGKVVWNAADGTFDMGLLNNVTLQAGQELHFYGKAVGAISNGQAVMFAGAQGDHALMTLADAATINANPEYFIGIATQDFANNQFGYVTVLGKVRGLNTSAYTAGDLLYYNSTSATDGLLTATMPSAPNAKILVAAVLRVHANEGILLVRPHTMPKISDIQDVSISSLANNNFFVYDSATSVWKNKTIAAALGYTPANDSNVVKLTGDQTVAGAKTFTSVINASTLSINGGTLVGNNIVSMRSNPTGGQFRIEKSDGSLSAYPFYIGVDGTALAYYYNAAGALKVLLHTDNTSYFGNSLSIGYSTYATTSYMLDVNGTGRFISSVNVQNFLTVSSASTLVAPSSGKSIEMVYRTDGANDYAFIQTYDRTNSVFKQLRITGSTLILNEGGGNVGFGLTNPQSQIHLNGTITFSESGYDTVRLHTITHSHSDGSNVNNWLSFNVSNGSGVTNTALRLNGAGQLRLNSYTASSSFSGTAAGYLAFDSSGNVITVAGVAATDNTKLPLAGGTMTGTPVFTAAWGNAGGDYTGITNPAYKVDVASGYWRVVYKGAHATVSGVYNFETGKNVYWGEPTDTGDYIFRGKTLKWANSAGTEYAVIHAENISSYTAGSSQQVTINYNNDSNSTYQLLWGSGNSVYGTSQVYVNPSSDVIYARGGYISPSNPWGTSDSAFFPNGITTAGSRNWIYGATYIGNAPGNGQGVDIGASGNAYFRSNVGTSSHGSSARFLEIQSGAGNFIPYSFESEYGNHSWGTVMRIRINQSGADRPSIQFSSASSDNRWNVGYCYVDDNFRVTQNMGYRNDNSTTDGWGTERFRINTDGNTYAAIGGTLYANGTQVVTNNGGTWNIAISGNATTATTATNSGQLNGISSTQIFNNMGNNHTTYTDFNSVGGFGVRYLQGSTNGPGTGATQYYGFTLGLGNDYPQSGSGSYGTQFYWNRTSTGGNPYVSVRFNENGSWGGWTRIYAGYADSAGTASNITAYTINQSVGTGNSPSFAEGIFGSTGGANNQGIQIRYQNYVSGYGRIRFYQSDSNHATIHVFSSSWQNGSLASSSTGAINLDSGTGITFGPWNNPDAYVVTGGQTYARGYRGIGNVAGTGEASYHPAGIYSTGNNWLYGNIMMNGNSISGANSISGNYFYGSGSIRCGDMWGGAGLYLPSGAMVFGTEANSWIFSSQANTRVTITPGGAINASGNITSTGGNLRSNNWVYSEGNSGWYNDTYGQGLRQVKGNVSYGQVIVYGENYNGWSGYNTNNSTITAFMQNSSGTHGFYQENNAGWTLFWNAGYACWGLGTDATDPAYSLHITKYGGSNTGWIIWSDRRIKENIKTIDGALDKILSLRGVYYNKIDDPNKERQVGYIAQEVLEVVPELVVYSEELDIYNMNYAPMVSMLTEATKEHYAKTLAQQTEIDALKEQVQTLLNHINNGV